MSGFLGRGLGAAAGGYFAGNILGLKERQRQEEKGLDQELRRAQIDSLNAQRNASQKDPKEHIKQFALASAKTLDQMLHDPKNNVIWADNPALRKNVEAYQKKNLDYLGGKVQDYLYDPEDQRRVVDAVNAAEANHNLMTRGPFGGGQPQAPPFGAGEAEAKLAGDPNASPGFAMFGGLPQMQMPDIGRAGMQAPSAMGPMLGGFQPGSSDLPGAYQKMAGAMPAAPEKAVRPAPKPKPQAAANPPPKPTVEEMNARALAHFEEVKASEPTMEQVVADMPNALPVDQRAEYDKRSDRFHQRMTRAFQGLEVYNKQSVGEADAKSRGPLNEALLRQRGAAAGLSEAQILQLLDPQSIKNRGAEAEIERKRESTRIAAAAQKETEAHNGVTESIAWFNAKSSRKQADTSAAGQKDLAKHRKALVKHMEFLEKTEKVPPLLLEKFKNWRAKLTQGRTSISGVGSFGAGDDAALAAEEQALMGELSNWQGSSGGGAAAGGGSAAGSAETDVRDMEASGDLDSTMAALRTSNPARYKEYAAAYLKVKKKPYGAKKKKK